MVTDSSAICVILAKYEISIIFHRKPEFISHTVSESPHNHIQQHVHGLGCTTLVLQCVNSDREAGCESWETERKTIAMDRYMWFGKPHH